MTPTEFLRERNIVDEDKNDLIIHFEGELKESLIEILESYHKTKLTLLGIDDVTLNEVALPIGTEVIFKGKQRFITKYTEYNNKLAYRLNGTEETEIFLRSDFEEIHE